eukprot:NODE_6774_length_1640_cov_3.545274.p1 GENE.NODE_6774_length_1640_cov_3.545274~~NODE_6774_length_1640_cov_3.545274.p1  ORF type:complete len:213 (+),score=62.88 NODE_6774_length_1640_cov_3.545274:441-1079(+)
MPASVKEVQNESDVNAAPVRCFHDYFCWAPTPTIVLSRCLQSHGQVAAVHMVNFAEATGLIANARSMLRAIFKRDVRNVSAPTTSSEAGGNYMAIPAEARDDFTNFTAPAMRSVEDQIRNDNNLCEYYIVFRCISEPHRYGGAATPKANGGSSGEAVELPPSPPASSMEHERHALWREHAARLLEGHGAASLIGVQTEDDTERSLLELRAPP